jgi:hypothetical protein
MLMGLVTKNAILLVDFTNQGLREGQVAPRRDPRRGPGAAAADPDDDGAMIFGMLPLAAGLSDGGEQNAPMGRAVIGGVITSTLLTLVVVPVLYTYLDAWGRKAKSWITKKPPRFGGQRRGAGSRGARGGLEPDGASVLAVIRTRRSSRRRGDG